MLPTFVIGLREALEASLIVGIIAAFLGRAGRRDLMRWVVLGVAAAVLLCAGGGIALYVVSGELPQQQQEALETVVGLIAVAMVTYMVVWMKRHSRDLKKQLEGFASNALAEGSAWALVGMAFLAVLREGFETAVFLVAAFNESTSTAAAGGGALLGIAVAIGLGYGIYRGGVRLNLSKFFRITGVVLVLVAAGLVQTALRTAHEAGWLDWGQQATVNLSALVTPGSVQSALITGMLGISARPTLIELTGWLLYLVPVGLYVVWPPGRRMRERSSLFALAGAVAAVALVLGSVVAFAPSTSKPAVAAGGGTVSTSRTVEITLSQKGCSPAAAQYESGALTFRVSNTDAAGTTEIELRQQQRIIGEKENLPPGFSGTFTLQMDPGEYTLVCPGTDQPQSTLTVAGTARTTAGTDTGDLLTQGAKDYGQYIELQAGLLVENTKPLVTAIQSGNLAESRVAYAKARAYYERVEPVAESFTTAGGDNLDADIDARQGDVPDDQWRGFHVIEQGLWVTNSTAGLAGVATQLQGNVEKLQGLVEGLTYQPAEIANGAVSLLDEVAQNKVTGEEERYSHIDLLDFASNVEGAQQAFVNLQPGLTKIDPAIVTTISTEFTACLAALATYADSANPSGYVYYTQLTPADVTTLSQAVQALQEPLSQVAGKVVTAS